MDRKNEIEEINMRGREHAGSATVRGSRANTVNAWNAKWGRGFINVKGDEREGEMEIRRMRNVSHWYAYTRTEKAQLLLIGGRVFRDKLPGKMADPFSTLAFFQPFRSISFSQTFSAYPLFSLDTRRVPGRHCTQAPSSSLSCAAGESSARPRYSRTYDSLLIRGLVSHRKYIRLRSPFFCSPVEPRQRGTLKYYSETEREKFAEPYRVQSPLHPANNEISPKSKKQTKTKNTKPLILSRSGCASPWVPIGPPSAE